MDPLHCGSTALVSAEIKKEKRGGSAYAIDLTSTPTSPPREGARLCPLEQELDEQKVASLDEKGGDLLDT
jgi:hypothetical protein